MTPRERVAEAIVLSRVGEIREEGVCVSGEDEFSSALRSAIDRRGLSLGQISHQLRSRGRPVSISSISHWQSGRSRPVGPQSLGALAAMEEILRSEEHTSELQSRGHLVCRLLLAKKK